MTTANPYLAFNGNCEEAFAFYKSIFGGEYRQFSRFKEIPPMPGQELPASAMDRILHVSLPISAETVLMGSDSNPTMGEVPFGKNVSLCLNVDSPKEADRLFGALSVGGTITMPIADMFWGSYFGMLTDKFGVNWMVSYEKKK